MSYADWPKVASASLCHLYTHSTRYVELPTYGRVIEWRQSCSPARVVAQGSCGSGTITRYLYGLCCACRLPIDLIVIAEHGAESYHLARRLEGRSSGTVESTAV